MNVESTPPESLNERAQHLLRVLVQSYIREGQPVGSRALSRDSGLSLSSATIRNVMADLEDLGFVSSPHTSAGRVPTDRGYRFFVDALLRAELPAAENAELKDLREQLDASHEGTKELVAAASQLLSRITNLAGLVTMPLAPAATLTQIEFVGLAEQRVLVILVFNDREVQNRIIQLERHYSPEELRRAANVLNEHCRNRSLSQVHAELLRQLRETHASINQVMLDAISMAQQVCAQSGAQEGIEYVIAGETNLMGLAELSSVDKLKRLFEAFTEKRDILHLLDQSLRADGVQIFIGHESGYQILDDCSVITAPYSTGGGVAGVLGVIGPTRMAYERVIPIVDITARLLGSALNSRR
ncbi:MAG TPA: heat-inducible transcriptional repressor HrcA [Steroidobacteraceae bacterium]|nr:heat-inducible transcriptional repressor HrcA [Steroidobacteraceae bacterium]